MEKPVAPLDVVAGVAVGRIVRRGHEMIERERREERLKQQIASYLSS
jgi:predicted membrane-bound mannosyltransferase